MADSRKPPPVYWDTSLFISFLTGREADKMNHVETLIGQARQSSPVFSIVLSQFVRVELRDYPDNDRERTETIRRLFLAMRPGIGVNYYAVNRQIAAYASDIGNRFPEVTPADAVHVATALTAGVDRMWTYDGITRKKARRSGKLASFDGEIDGLRITEPNADHLLPLFDPKFIDQPHGDSSTQPEELKL